MTYHQSITTYGTAFHAVYITLRILIRGRAPNAKINAASVAAIAGAAVAAIADAAVAATAAAAVADDIDVESRLFRPRFVVESKTFATRISWVIPERVTAETKPTTPTGRCC